MKGIFRGTTLLMLLWVAVDVAWAVDGVSYIRDVAPLFRRHCNGCHHPGKEKGGVDLTTVGAMLREGRHGPAVVPGDPVGGTLLGEIQGPEPAMPKEGDPLSAAQVNLVMRWIREGALDDTPARVRPVEPPVYRAAPSLTAMAMSSDGRWMAVPGRGEVLVFEMEGMTRVRRLLGTPVRVEWLAFSPDSTRLAVFGGDPGVTGEVQVWDPVSGDLAREWVVGADAVLGGDWSPDGTRLVCGGADRVVRVLGVTDGLETMRVMPHSDWVFGAVFVDGGRRVVSGSRDRTLRLLESDTGKLVDVVNRDSEPVVRLLRRPGHEEVAFAGAEFRPRLYRAKDRGEGVDPGKDPNFVREFDGFGDGMTAMAFSADGGKLATAGVPAGEVRVYDVGDAKRVQTFKGHAGPVYALGFSKDGRRVMTGGAEGLIRVFGMEDGRMQTNFCPVEVRGDLARP